MRPLLWKEMRELRPWVAGATVLAVVLELWCLSRSFGEGFQYLFLVMMPLLAVLVAAALGVGQIARERHTRTLEFVLVRPVALRTILWVKFLAGTVAVCWIAAAMTLVAYTDHEYTSTELNLIRGLAPWWRLLLALLPKVWFVYALALVCSVVADRVAKAVAMAIAMLIALGGFLAAYATLEPLVGVEVWLPGFESTFALLRVARDPALAWSTGLVLGMGAVGLVWCGGRIFSRNAGRPLGDGMLGLFAAGFVGLAIAANLISFTFLELGRPAGSMALATKLQTGDLDAAGGVVGVGLEDGVVLMDFTSAAQPRKLAEVHLPLWTTLRVVMGEGRAYLVGTRKALPSDQAQIVPLTWTAAGAVQVGGPVPMGVVGPNDYLGAAVAAGRFLYVAAVVNLRCQVRVFDLETARELEPVQLDEVAKCLPDPTRPCRKASVNMRAGGRYLYVASPARLTAIDIGDPGHAVAVVSREHYDPLSLFYGVERELVISGGALYEQVWLPPAVRAYRLGGSNGLAYEGETTWRSGLGNWHVAASARALYRPWRAGLVEYERSGQGFHVLRYLSGGKAYEASRVVVAGEYVYTLGYDEKLKQPRVTAYKIRP